MNEFGMIPFWFQLTKLWPLLFVAIGVSFILKSKNKNAWESWKEQNGQQPVNPENNPVASAEKPAGPVAPENPATPDTSSDQAADNETNDPLTKKDI
ncbi:hypothetical protein D3C78_1600450 [compost metagenome]